LIQFYSALASEPVNFHLGTYSAIFGYMSHEESSKLEERKRNHAEDGVKPASTLKGIAIQLPPNCCKIIDTVIM
jgi:hypothetical protein